MWRGTRCGFSVVCRFKSGSEFILGQLGKRGSWTPGFGLFSVWQVVRTHLCDGFPCCCMGLLSPSAAGPLPGRAGEVFWLWWVNWTLTSVCKSNVLNEASWENGNVVSVWLWVSIWVCSSVASWTVQTLYCCLKAVLFCINCLFI